MLSVAPSVSRKHLSADSLYGLLRKAFARVPDPRELGSAIPLEDSLMSALAMFAIKDPSLVAYQERRNDANLKTIFQIGTIPSDTHMREVLDLADPDMLHFAFSDVFRQAQRGKSLERYVFHKGCYLVSIDATGYFSVDQVQQICNPAFKAAWQKAGSKRALWERVRSHFYHFLFRTMEELYEAISTDRCKELPLPRLDSS